MKPEEKIFKYKFEDYLKRRSAQLFGRETSVLKRRKLEEDFKKEIFGSLSSISKKNLEEVIRDLEREKWKTTDVKKRSFIENKIYFLRKFAR